jgi:four helix bundle protein
MKNTYRDLRVWQESVALAKEVYFITKTFPKEEIFGLTSQMRRAAVSVPSNIAEGQCRNSSKEFLKFLSYSSGSLGELDTQLEISLQLGFLHETQKESLDERMLNCRKMLAGLQSRFR